MSTKARKERRGAGVKFVRQPKVGTPLEERAWFAAVIPGAPGTRHAFKLRPRSDKKRERALASRRRDDGGR